MMKKFLNNNLVLKIISVTVAFIIWLLVNNIDDPQVIKTYSVPVTTINSAYLESSGLTYQNTNPDQEVTVIMRGNRSVVNNREKDIRVTADLTQIVDMNTKPVMVPVTATVSGVSVANISVVPQSIAINIEDIVSKDFTITVSAGDTVPYKDFQLGSLTSTPEKVTITGPKSLVAKIDRVQANVDVTQLRADTSRSVNLTVFDKNQDELTDNQMGYLKFDIGEPKVVVSIDLWRVREDVKLEVGASGSPAAGYELGQVMATPALISVAGTDEALADLASSDNKIVIPPEAISVEGATSNVEEKIDLKDYLPKNIIVANSGGTVIVTATIFPQGTKELSIPSKNIEVENLDKDLRLVFDKDSVTIRVKGSQEALASLRPASIRASLDVESYPAGDFQLPLHVNLPEGCELIEPIQCLVHISEPE